MRWSKAGRALVAAALLGGTLGWLSLPVGADVTPGVVDATIDPGASVNVAKTVDVPQITPKLDLALLVDMSGSYGDDLANLQAKAGDLYDGITASVPDAQFAVSSFVDMPLNPFGSVPDYGFQRDSDFVTSRDGFINAVNSLTLLGGGDFPESQYEGLYQVASGAGREVGTADGDFDDVGDISPQPLSWRSDATHVVAITTDAAFHTPADGPCTFPTPPCPINWPGASRDDAIGALNARGIRVIAIKAPGSGAEMDDAAAATGGSVVTTDASSSQIVDAILAGLSDLTFDVTPDPNGCGPLVLTYDPPVHEDVPGDTSVGFNETIAVPAGTGGQVVHCTVDFLAGTTVIGTQVLNVTITGPPSSQPPPPVDVEPSFTG
jgi:hypothetical protein